MVLNLLLHSLHPEFTRLPATVIVMVKLFCLLLVHKMRSKVYLAFYYHWFFCAINCLKYMFLYIVFKFRLCLLNYLAGCVETRSVYIFIGYTVLNELKLL